MIPQPDPLHLPPRRAHQRDPLQPRLLGDPQSRGQVHRWRPTPRRPRPPPPKSWASSGTCSAPWTATATTTWRTTGATRSPRTDPTRSSPATTPRPTVGPTAARPRTRCAGLPNLLCSSRLAAHSLGPRAPKATSTTTPPRSGASGRRAEQTVGGAAHTLPTNVCRAPRRRRRSATPAGPPGTILWGHRRKASTRLVRTGHLERLRTQTYKDLLTLFYKLRWGTQEDLNDRFYSSSPTCTRTWCSPSRSSSR